MVLQVPPAVIESAPLPANVHLDLRSTRRGAEKSGRQQVVCILPEDETRFQEALVYLRTLEGTWLRSRAEVWLAKPGQPEIQSLMDKAELRSLPAIVQMDAKAQTVRDYMLGPDVAPLDQACRTLLQRENAFNQVPSAKIKEWSGGMDPEPFVTFGQARATDLGAAAKPPFCRWLVDLVRGADPKLQLWAATRLLEANAPLQPGDPDVWGILLRDCEQQFRNTIQGQEPEQRPIPWRKLGLPGIVDLEAPFWPAFRALLRSQKAPRIGSTIYALIAPALLAEDRDWVLKAFSSTEASLNGMPWNNAVFWVGADWLLAYGKPGDWAAFQTAQLDKSWRNAIHEIEFEVKQIPTYWNASPTVQDMFCEGQTADTFWKNPDACLSSWGITRENLIELGFDQIHLLKGGAFPKYPQEAKRLGFSGMLRVRTLVDGNGKVLWARPLPGYALCFFAPFGIRYSANATFEPGKVGGVGRPSIFMFTFPFRLKR